MRLDLMASAAAIAAIFLQFWSEFSLASWLIQD
jgi:hypothetical protein